MQNQKGATAGKYLWAWPSVVTVAREEGLRALYKGLGPRLVRLGPGGGIMIVAFDWVAELIR
jgi:solute carrier family 25 2-oxodicarboxylate transporter 21